MMQSTVLQSGASGPLDTLVSVTVSALESLVSDVVAALPRILAGIIFLVVAAIGIKLVKMALGTFLKRAFPKEPKVYRQFLVAIVMLFLWFGAGLSFLSIVGMEQIAASLGSAAGFLALGISYALSNVIADVVAGVYLLRDPDFMPGDEVDIGGTVGTVRSIELRKTRLTVNDGEDTMVRNNAEIEKKWTKLDDDSPTLDPTTNGTADADAATAGAAAATQVADETDGTVEHDTDEPTDAVEEPADGADDAFTDADVKQPDE